MPPILWVATSARFVNLHTAAKHLQSTKMPHFEPARKRRRHDEEDEELLYTYYNPKQPQDDTLMAQHRDAWPRKILPIPSKRTKLSTPRLLEEDAYNWRLQQSKEDTTPATPRNRREYLMTPCHVCGDHPTKASQLDAFAHCLGCGEWTCYICIRQCQGWNGEEGSVLSEQEALSRSFQMDDDDGEVSPKSQPKHRRGRIGSWKAYGHQSIICRRCCVEPQETDGEVACFGCYQRFPAHGA